MTKTSKLKEYLNKHWGNMRYEISLSIPRKKINALIEEYGNAVITDVVSLCIKTDESIRLKDWHNLRF